MGVAATDPVVRVWEITGIGVDDPAVVDALRAEVTPRIQGLPGWLGGYMMIDHDRSSLISVGFWSDAQTLEASSELSARMAEAVATLTSGTATRHWSCELIVADRPDITLPGTAAVDG